MGGRGKSPELSIGNLISNVALLKPEPQSIDGDCHTLSHLTELSRASVTTTNCGCAWGKLNRSVYRRQMGGMVVP